MHGPVGKHAKGLCMRCGQTCMLNALVEDGHVRGLLVCSECYDPKHPQEEPPSIDDPVTLDRASPDDPMPALGPALSTVIPEN